LARSIGSPSTLVGTTVNSKLRLGTDVTNLVATSTAGGVYINQLQGLASANVHATGGNTGNIELLTATGDLNIQSMTASGLCCLPQAATSTRCRAPARLRRRRPSSAPAAPTRTQDTSAR